MLNYTGVARIFTMERRTQHTWKTIVKKHLNILDI